MLRNADGGGVGGVRFSRKKRYEGVRFNVICVTRGWVGVHVTRGWVGVQFPEKSVKYHLNDPFATVSKIGHFRSLH